MTTITSFDDSTDRALDSMLVVYSLLEGHPASTACSQFISERTGWFTSVLVILEAKAILTKVYGVSAELVSQKLTELVSGADHRRRVGLRDRNRRFRFCGFDGAGPPGCCLAAFRAAEQSPMDRHRRSEIESVLRPLRPDC